MTDEANTHRSPVPLWACWRWALHWQILLGIVLGLLAGAISGSVSTVDGVDLQSYAFLGGLFMQALKMLIIPLIVTSIIAAMYSLGHQKGFARMGGKTLLFYVCSSFIAIMIGLVLVNTIRPGEGGLSKEDLQAAVAEGEQEQAAMAKIMERSEGRGTGDILNVIKELIPENIVDVASSNSHLLGVIVFSMLFGFFISRVETERRATLEHFWSGSHDVMVAMTMFVMRFAPLGVGFLIAKTTAEAVINDNFMERLYQLFIFAVCVVLALSLHALVVMPLALKFIGGVSPLAHMRSMGPALMFAFSSASSASTLPLTMECVENRSRVSKRTSSFVLPLGATVNMDGTALYECVAVLFVCQIYGIPMDFGMQFMVVALALLTSIGVAGIPSASLVAIVIILNSISHQVGVDIGYEAIAIILIFDRILDMCRTAVNVWGDSCAAVIIGRSEGEEQILQPALVDPGSGAHDGPRRGAD